MNFINALKNSKTRKKILITLFILTLYVIGRYIPAPGIKGSITSLNDNTMLSILRMFGGGSTLERLSIFALGVGPYINASIIIELLSMDVIKPLSELKKTQKGRKRLEYIMICLSIVLSLLQGYFLASTLRDYIDNPTALGFMFVSVMFTIGMLIAIGMGKAIDKWGFGEDKGITMLIFSGIMMSLPEEFKAIQASYGWSVFAIVLFLFLLIIVGIIIVQLAERRIPIQYSKAINKTKGNLPHLPLKINSASIMPVIFASSVLQAPQIITSWFSYESYKSLSEKMGFDKWYMVLIYALLIFAFTFIYSHIRVDTNKITDDLAKGNGYVPGVRPGRETLNYVNNVFNSITLLGAILITLLAIFPYLVNLITKYNIVLSGTSLIIVVGAAIEIIEKLRVDAIENKYKNIIGK